MIALSAMSDKMTDVIQGTDKTLFAVLVIIIVIKQFLLQCSLKITYSKETAYEKLFSKYLIDTF